MTQTTPHDPDEIRPVRTSWISAALVVLALASCAVPMAPSGGPPDRRPPGIELVEPENGAVNFAASIVKITFDEYINEPSFQQALSITPEPPERPEVHWSKRTVEVRFRQAPEPNTTYIITIDTKLRDYHGVSLQAPITVAFSTGPEINRGRIRGSVLTPVRGSGASGTQVFAYPLPESARLESLPERPLYRTETDASGEFHFEYLSTRPYFVLAVRDRNGNRRPDNQEVIAVPPVETIAADSAGIRIEKPWITTVLDTVPPELRRVEAVASTRLSARYSEDVVAPLSASEWSLTGSPGQQDYPVQFAYMLPDDRRQVFLQTDTLQVGTYVLTPAAVRDSVGNRALQNPTTFEVTSLDRDGGPRFLTFIPRELPDGQQLHPSVEPGVLFDRPVTAEQLRRGIAVEDTAGSPLGYSISSPDGVRHLLAVEEAGSGRPFRVRVLEDSPFSADSTARREFSYLTERQLGGIIGVIADTPADTALIVEVMRPETPVAVASTLVGPTGRFSIGNLQQGSYSLRVTRDDNGNGRWDGGDIAPFRPAEPLFWTSDSLRVRARWDTDLDTLRIPHF